MRRREVPKPIWEEPLPSFRSFEKKRAQAKTIRRRGGGPEKSNLKEIRCRTASKDAVERGIRGEGEKRFHPSNALKREQGFLKERGIKRKRKARRAEKSASLGWPSGMKGGPSRVRIKPEKAHKIRELFNEKRGAFFF